MTRFIPAGLVMLRFAIAPLLLWDASDRQVTGWFIAGYVIAVLSDIFDGIIARRLKVSTAQLRQADGWADVCLYTCVAASAWLVYPEVVIAFRLPLIALLVAQVTLYAFCVVKYGKAPSYHTYTAKAWGLGLFVAAIALFGFGQGVWLWLAIGLGLVNSIEEIIMTLVLPTWHHDVLSLKHALDLQNRDKSVAVKE
ncbi:CDP-alcohol phosphatidyltransferase family protein [Oscillatoria sp. FACHB-1407]|uniref:CDP-alcohol phosphatidyltransferase family protein n=1 Tax=Oscillatoria sp. FACHB-1407 TaxID=2692847 RepID=UPI0016844CAE|nr:CDP-alcohol phosphatidyltransferase family protein [Oscillatoria sp. FACHB-1407]MBD2462826.1 CDP-alcohol phosphatidyltransferase family protein [Oscillatoria sp. FACHB-1407]